MSCHLQILKILGQIRFWQIWSKSVGRQAINKETYNRLQKISNIFSYYCKKKCFIIAKLLAYFLHLYVYCMLSYGIWNLFQPDFGHPLISQHNLRFIGYNWSSSFHWCWGLCKISCANKWCMLWILIEEETR